MNARLDRCSCGHAAYLHSNGGLLFNCHVKNCPCEQFHKEEQ